MLKSIAQHAAFRRFASIILRDAAILAVAALCLELLLRVWAPQYGKMVFDADYTASKPIAMNEDGYRGPLLPVDKAQGEIRLLSLGDSVTFGTGVAFDDTWPQVLARDLAQYAKGTADVIGYGVPGAGLQDLRFAYERKWDEYEPDFVILLATGQLVGRTYAYRDREPSMPPTNFHSPDAPLSTVSRLRQEANRAIHFFCLPSFISQTFQSFLYVSGLGRHEVNPAIPFGVQLAYGVEQSDLPRSTPIEAWNVFERELQSLKAAVHDRGETLVVGFAPPRFVLGTGLFDNPKLFPVDRITLDAANQLQIIASRLGIPCADITQTLRGNTSGVGEKSLKGFRNLYIPVDYTHFSELGHKRVAEAFRSCIEFDASRGSPVAGGNGTNAVKLFIR